MESVASQLSAAVFALIATMLDKVHTGPGVMTALYSLNFARWGLEGACACCHPALCCPQQHLAKNLFQSINHFFFAFFAVAAVHAGMYSFNLAGLRLLQALRACVAGGGVAQGCR